jgi:hypothetical protein
MVHTIFISHGLANSHGRFLVRVLEYKDFGEFYSESATSLALIKCEFDCICRNSLLADKDSGMRRDSVSVQDRKVVFAAC